MAFKWPRYPHRVSGSCCKSIHLRRFDYFRVNNNESDEEDKYKTPSFTPVMPLAILIAWVNSVYNHTM